MVDVKWIKLAVDMFDNRKIRQIETLPDGDGIIVIWVKLLCLAGITNDGGLIYFTRDIPYTEQMLAAYFQRPIALVQMALRVFQQFGMIEMVDDLLMVSGWEKYQNLDKLEKIQAQNRDRQRRFKERKRQEALPVALPVTQGNATDIDKEEDIDIDNIPPISPKGETPKPKKKAEPATPDYSQTHFSPAMIAKVDEWLGYKQEKHQPYKPTGLKSLITQIQKQVDRHGEGAVIQLMDGCMAANYQGIIWDKLDKGQGSAARQPEGSGNPFADYLRDRQDIVGAYDYQEDRNDEY